ncbi:short chain dehydrogenase [Ectocarpus siliculosus]|uniref:Short chain dehydrogenase n=1 Tax=Ectocarpus siliculosus TaxID=2880 RepID=D8LK39_ECTSI|nr:short chain dehydrogenase [Ectocarpus siliculosus]|eukprot:CBN74508.1 short chain dehydrogenase [Ectocarpus siliculosus]
MVGITLRSFAEGNESGPTVVFVHGWPDDHTLWDAQVAHLKDRYRCVTTDLPGFSGDEDGDGGTASSSKWGYSFEEVAKRLERTIEDVGKGKPVFVVAHDWGCFYAFMLEKNRPDLVKKLVALDVGGGLSFWPSLSLLSIALYQTYLMVAFLIGGRIGDAMARGFARLAGAPAASTVARASVCYPYIHFWKSQIQTCLGMGPFMPRCPVLFMYGSAGMKKLMRFHADWWVDKISKRKGSSVVEVTEASHWLMRGRGGDVVNARLDTFFAEG